MRKTPHLAFVSTVLALMSCAPAVDVDTFAEQLQQCLLAVPAPICSYGPDAGPDASHAAIAFFVDRSVTPSVEACVLAVDCSDERMASDERYAVQDEVNACFPDDPPETRSQACLDDCSLELESCTGTTTIQSIVGLDEFCDAADVTWCLEERERCRESC